MSWKTDKNAPLGTPAINLTRGDVTPQVPVGTIARFVHDTYGPGEFIYLRSGAGGTSANRIVYFSLNGGDVTQATTAAGANTGRLVAVSPGVTGANEYGWFQISGLAVVAALAGVANGQAVYTSATAGHIQAAASAGGQVAGALVSSALNTPINNTVYVTLNRPHMQTQIT